jgi:hypothetical protein
MGAKVDGLRFQVLLASLPMMLPYNEAPPTRDRSVPSFHKIKSWPFLSGKQPSLIFEFLGIASSSPHAHLLIYGPSNHQITILHRLQQLFIFYVWNAILAVVSPIAHHSLRGNGAHQIKF